jgi:hypothetical protein
MCQREPPDQVGLVGWEPVECGLKPGQHPLDPRFVGVQHADGGEQVA